MTKVHRDTGVVVGVFFCIVLFVLPLIVNATSHCTPESTDPNCFSGPSQSGYLGQPGPQASNQLQNPTRFNSITEFFAAILDILIIFAVPIIVFFLIWSGFLYVTAQGDAAKIKKATTAFTWTIVGGVLILGAWVLVEVIQGTVNALR